MGVLFMMGLLLLKYGVTLISRKYLQITNIPKPFISSEIASNHLNKDLDIQAHRNIATKIILLDKSKRENKKKEIRRNENAL